MSYDVRYCFSDQRSTLPIVGGADTQVIGLGRSARHISSRNTARSTSSPTSRSDGSCSTSLHGTDAAAVMKGETVAVKIIQFLAIVISALALIPAGAHLAALPNKIALPQADYFTVQGIYYGWPFLDCCGLPGLS
ncbi:hypothetical protein [Candidatus Phyllobacterium onerii]|uniref:hypothetical protein n=1 Tax=Candidatus Phyllobacterium onerii TaxID=3020828 RepID=UPI00232AE932|nr:hypothetical protein [Phyllobacterium sp. IY22]